MTKPINLHEEAFAVHWVRLAAEALSNGHTHFICNDLRLPKQLSLEKQTFLMLELISREPRPFVEYLESDYLKIVEIYIRFLLIFIFLNIIFV